MNKEIKDSLDKYTQKCENVAGMAQRGEFGGRMEAARVERDSALEELTKIIAKHCPGTDLVPRHETYATYLRRIANEMDLLSNADMRILVHVACLLEYFKARGYSALLKSVEAEKANRRFPGTEADMALKYLCELTT